MLKRGFYMARPKIDFKVEFTYRIINKDIIDITAPMKEQIYIISGTNKTMIIDNGMGIGSLKEYIKQFNLHKDIIMVDTHGHPDHAGGNIEFDNCYLNPLDLPVYKKMVTKEYRAGDVRNIFANDGKIFIDNLLDFKENTLPLVDGQEFDLGNRKIKCYLVPGHTEGSMVLYDENTKTLFVGDALTLKETWLYLWYSTSLKTYYESLLHPSQSDEI